MSLPAASAPPPSRPGLRTAWGRLDLRQRRVAAAALLVLVTMILPWYSEDTVVQSRPGSIVRSGGSVSGLAGMSFIEAGLLVVLLGIFALLWGRGTGRRFTLPFPDGALVCAAAGWMGALIVYRLFARPHGTDSAQEHTLIGLNWGIFVSLLAVGLLFAAGFDLRRHGPRTVAAGEPAPGPPSPYPDVDPATMAVRPRPDDAGAAIVPARPDDQQPTTVVPSPYEDQAPTTVVPSPYEDQQSTTAVPSPYEDRQPTTVVPSPGGEPPTRPAPTVPADPPTAVAPPRGPRTPAPPPAADAAETGRRDGWPSRMRRTPTPRKRDPGAPD